jgi:hypothetical protein
MEAVMAEYKTEMGPFGCAFFFLIIVWWLVALPVIGALWIFGALS